VASGTCSRQRESRCSQAMVGSKMTRTRRAFQLPNLKAHGQIGTTYNSLRINHLRSGPVRVQMGFRTRTRVQVQVGVLMKHPLDLTLRTDPLTKT